MIPRWCARSYAFASPEAGFDYFTSVAHYQSVAGRIIAALGGFTAVVMTGDPPPIPQILYKALTAAAASQYRVIGFSCGPELGRDELLRPSRKLLDPSAGFRTTSEYRLSSSPAPRLFLFDDAARLSGEQIEQIFANVYSSTQNGDRRNTSAVLLASPDFLARLERTTLRLWLAERVLIARLRFQELGADEVLAFIRHQLSAGEAEHVFTKDTVTAIANVSGGDPMLVNRFSRRLLDLAATNTAKNFEKAADGQTRMALTASPLEKCRLTTPPELLRDAAVLDPARDLSAQVSTRVWRGFKVTAMVSIVIVACLASFGGIGALFTHPAKEKVFAFSPLTGEASATDPESELSVGESAPSVPAETASAAPASGSMPTVLAGTRAERAPAATAPAPPTPEAASTITAQTAVLRHWAGTTEPTGLAEDVPPLPVAFPRPASPSGNATTGVGRDSAEGILEHAMAPATTDPAVPPSGAEAAPTKTEVTPPVRPEATATIVRSTPIRSSMRPIPLVPENTALVIRGNQLLGIGDVTSARLYYERAADAGDGQAALMLGMTFDRAFFNSDCLRGVRCDSASAISWYRRARELGQAEAEILLKKLNPEFSDEPAVR
jgi:hypothetical protein